jgi:hypothetical protein
MSGVSLFPTEVEIFPPRAAGIRTRASQDRCGPGEGHNNVKEQENTPAWRERAQWVRAEVKRLLDEANPPLLSNGGDRRSDDFQSRDTRLNGKDADTADRVVRRLKRDDPELAERVISGEISKNAHRKCQDILTLSIRSRSELESAASEVHNQLRYPSDVKVARILEET